MKKFIAATVMTVVAASAQAGDWRVDFEPIKYTKDFVAVAHSPLATVKTDSGKTFEIAMMYRCESKVEDGFVNEVVGTLDWQDRSLEMGDYADATVTRNGVEHEVTYSKTVRGNMFLQFPYTFQQKMSKVNFVSGANTITMDIPLSNEFATVTISMKGSSAAAKKAKAICDYYTQPMAKRRKMKNPTL